MTKTKKMKPWKLTKINKPITEMLCQVCDRTYQVWYVENSLWNLLVQYNHSIQFLCPTCFTVLIQKISKKSITWKLSIPND